MRKTLRKRVIALTLAGVTSISHYPIKSFAEVIKVENDVQQERTNPEEEIDGYELKNNDETIVHEGDLDIGSGNNKIKSENASLTINGDLEGQGGGVGVHLSDSSLNVEGDVNNTSITANNSQVDIGGDISHSVSGNSAPVIIGSNNTINVEGNMTSNTMLASGGGNEINVKGNMTYTGSNGGACIDGSGNKINVGGDLNVSSISDSSGVINVDCDLTANNLYIYGGGSTNVKGKTTLNGGISQLGSDSKLNDLELNNSYLEIVGDTTIGDIEYKGSSSNSYMIYNNIGKEVVTGNITVDQGSRLQSLIIGDATVNGNVNVNSDYSGGWAFLNPGKLTVNGDVNTGNMSFLNTTYQADVTINGNVVTEGAMIINDGGKFKSGNLKSNGRVIINKTDVQMKDLEDSEAHIMNSNVHLQSFNSGSNTTVENTNLTVDGDTNIHGFLSIANTNSGTNTANLGDINIDGNNGSMSLYLGNADLDAKSLKGSKEIVIYESNARLDNVETDKDVIVNSSDLSITGDLSAKEGVKLDGNTNNVAIEGTLDLNDKSLEGNANSLNNTDLTVWEIKTTADNLVSVTETANATDEQKELNKQAADNFEKNIKYLVKADDVKNGTISINRTSGTKEFKDKDGNVKTYNTAITDEVVTIDIVPNNGYEIESFSGRTATLVKISDTKYQLCVPRGGGVEITAIMKAIKIAEEIPVETPSKNNETPNETHVETPNENNETPNENNDVPSENPVTIQIDLYGSADEDILGFGPEKNPEFYNSNKLVANEDGTISCLDDNGALGVGFRFIRTANGYKWFYFDENHNMQIGWVKSNKDNKWYYLGADGILLRNTVTPDGYRVDEFGAYIE